MRAGRHIARAAFLVAALIAAPARAGTPIPEPPRQWVTDRARLLPLESAAALDARLAAYERGTGHQVLVYIDGTTGGVPIEEWAARAFQRWRVGREGIDDGVVLFLFVSDRRARIEVGYGLEASLPDARAARIIDEVIAPAMRAGKPEEAVRAGAEAVLAAVGGGAGAPGPDELVRQVPAWALGAGALLLVVLAIAFAMNPSLAVWLLFCVPRGRSGGVGGRRSGSGLPGGWFTGGGGRSGGGGASGSW
jgi:uncharacterized protein